MLRDFRQREDNSSTNESVAALAVKADVNVEQDVVELIAATMRTHGRLDLAFNNAGTEGEFTPFIEQSNAMYDQIFNANVRGVFWSMKYEAKVMLAQGFGSITNNASMGGTIGFANAGLYVARAGDGRCLPVQMAEVVIASWRHYSPPLRGPVKPFSS